MTTKLTLTVEKPIIEKAKYYAKNTGRSLSQLVENYLNSLVTENENQIISPSLLELTGKIKLPVNFDEKKELAEYYERKHL
jgi:Family of unknown function (DUF6364)